VNLETGLAIAAALLAGLKAVEERTALAVRQAEKTARVDPDSCLSEEELERVLEDTAVTWIRAHRFGRLLPDALVRALVRRACRRAKALVQAALKRLRAKGEAP